MSDANLPPEIEALRQAYLSALRGWTGEIERLQSDNALLREALEVCDRVLHFDLKKMITWGNDYNQAVKDAADAARAALQDKNDDPGEGKAAIEGEHEASKP